MLQGRAAVVTGGASGLGRAIAERLLAAGARVCVFDLNAAALAEMVTKSPGVITQVCDVCDPESIERALDAVAPVFRCVEILVNNAGIIHSDPLVNILAPGWRPKAEAWDRIIRADLSSVFYVTQQVAERMAKSRTKGVIVNISSVAARGNAGQGAYAAAKAGVNALTVTWAKELGVLGIRVGAVAPGFIDTPSTRAVLSEATLKDLSARVPLRRLGQPDEVAQAVLQIIENDYFTGRVLELDGGFAL